MRSGSHKLSLLLVMTCGCQHSPAVQEKTGPSERPVKVQMETVSTTESREQVNLPGTIRAVAVAPLSSKIMGQVLEVRVRAGDRARAGQALVLLDSRDTEAMVSKAQAGLNEAQLAVDELDQGLKSAQAQKQLAESTLKRYQDLFEKKSVSPQEFDEIRTRHDAAVASVEALQAKRSQAIERIKQARADIESSRALRSYTQVVMPFDGVVLERLVEPGVLAVPGAPLLTVESAGKFRLEVPVEESWLHFVKLNQRLHIEVDSIGLVAEGTVVEIHPAADPSTRTCLVKMDLPFDSRLKSGMFGEATLEVAPRSGIWIRPRSLYSHGQLQGVFVVDSKNRARLRLLRLGESRQGEIEVLAGLEQGERFVTELDPRLHNGSPVEVVP